MYLGSALLVVAHGCHTEGHSVHLTLTFFLYQYFMTDVNAYNWFSFFELCSQSGAVYIVIFINLGFAIITNALLMITESASVV